MNVLIFLSITFLFITIHMAISKGIEKMTNGQFLLALLSILFLATR